MTDALLAENMTILQVFQRLKVGQWLWVIEAYWRLWSIVLRIKVKQQRWLLSQFNSVDRADTMNCSQYRKANDMHESVRIAARLHFMPSECLPRSIALRQMLRARSYDAELILGVVVPEQTTQIDVITNPLISSHAWVEVAGMVVGEAKSVIDNFNKITVPLRNDKQER